MSNLVDLDRKIAMCRVHIWRALKVGILMGGGGFLVLSTLILKYSDVQDVFPQIRFVGILCVAVLSCCGLAIWDNFRVMRRLKKESCGHIESLSGNTKKTADCFEV